MYMHTYSERENKIVLIHLSEEIMGGWRRKENIRE
jgi:hypothetical protein